MLLMKFKIPDDIDLKDIEEPLCLCDDCGVGQHIIDVVPIRNPQTLVIGDIIPAGACSEEDCDDLMYLYEIQDDD